MSSSSWWLVVVVMASVPLRTRKEGKKPDICKGVELLQIGQGVVSQRKEDLEDGNGLLKWYALCFFVRSKFNTR